MSVGRDAALGGAGLETGPDALRYHGYLDNHGWERGQDLPQAAEIKTGILLPHSATRCRLSGS